MRMITNLTGILIAIVIIAFMAIFAIGVVASTQDEITERQQQIEEIQRQIEQYQQQIDATRTQSKTLENEINKLNAHINQLNLEIRGLDLSIKQTTYEIDETQDKISIAEDKIAVHKQAIGQYIKLIYDSDQKSLTEVLLNNDNLSDFFGELNSIKITQDKLKNEIDEIKSLKSDLEVHEQNLEDEQNELERTKKLQELEKRTLDRNKNSKNTLLKDTKGQESKFQELVKKSQKDIEAIRSEITYLAQNGVTAEEAVKYGQLAAIRTGIRPAFLIAELEIESGLGANVGKCNRPDDPPEKGWRRVMHKRDHDAFLSITSTLGLNPDITPVSCRQVINGRPFGWGGAMGPAQFIASTWLGYKDEVAQLTGHNPASPWNIEDAFMAAAAKLARAGAGTKTTAAEKAASKSYYSGRSTCSSAPCNNYANAIQRKAAEIETNL